MTVEETLIFWGGIHSLLFAVFHMLFWRLFRWKKELPKMHWSNQAILQIANVQLIWVFVVVGLVSVTLTDELVSTALGAAIRLGMVGFWLIRTVQQFIFLRKNHWAVHLLTFLFFLGTCLYGFTLF